MRATGGGPHFLPGLCSCSSLCAKQQAVSAQYERRGKEGEQEGEGDCALHVCSYTNRAPGPHSNAHRSGLAVIFAHPGRREWRGSGEE